MDEMHQRKDRYRRDRDDSRYKHASKHQDRPDRGRTYNYCPPPSNYSEDLKRYIRDRSRQRIRSRSASPVKGSDEYLTRKKLNTGALSKKKEATETMTTECRSAKRLMYTSEEIRQKIIQYVVKPNEGSKRNLINMKMDLDNALNLIDNRKRLEISKILRRTAISMTSGDGKVPVVADIGVDLRRDVIAELSKILGIDLEQLGLGTWLDPSEPFPPRLGHVLSTTVSPTVPKTSKLYDPHDPTLDNIQPEPHYIKANEPICDNKQIKNEFQSELPLVEVKKEPEEEPDSVDDIFVETFCPQAVRHEQTSNINYRDSEYERMTVINDPDNHRESSLKLPYSVRLIESTIKTFVEIDKKESDPLYTSFNELMDKIEGLERCSKLLDDYKNYLMRNLFRSFRKLRKEDQRYDSPQTPGNVEVRPSSDLQSELRETNESAVSIRKRGCEQEISAQEAKKMKLVVKDDQPRPGSLPNIEDRVSCLKYRHKTPKGGQDCLLIGTESGKVLLMDLATNQIYQTLDVCDGPVTSICLYRNRHVYVGTATKLLKIYTRDTTATAQGHRQLLSSQQMTNPILCITVSWRWVFIGCQKGTLIRYGPKDRSIELETTSESGLDILSLKTAKEGQRRVLIVNQRSGPLVIRDAESLVQLRIFYNQPEVVLSTVSAIAYADGRLFCGTVEDDVLQFEYHVEDAQLQSRLKVFGSKGITCLRILSNILLAGCTNGRVYFFDTLNKLALIKVLEGPGGSVNCLAFLKKQIAVSTVTRKLARIDIPPEVLSAFKDTPTRWAHVV